MGVPFVGSLPEDMTSGRLHKCDAVEEKEYKV